MSVKKLSMVSILTISFILRLLLVTCETGITTDNCRPSTPKKPPTIPVVHPVHPRFPPKGPPANPFCPRDTLKLGGCSELLGSVNIVIGTPPSSKCCTVLQGLTDLEAAACLCTAIKANVLGVNLNVPVSLSALISTCGKSIPPGFKCV